MNKGIWVAIGAYFLWGLFPIYWKLLNHVGATEILAHRMAWSFVFVLLLLAWRNRWEWLQVARRPKVLLIYLASATLLTINWLTYIWAVNAGHVVDTSLGYFINPLVNVLLGTVLLKERLRQWQWVAVGVALIGVLYLTLSFGVILWIALTLAFSFGLYGLVRKTGPLDSLDGLSLETALLFPLALGFLLWLQFNGTAAFGRIDFQTTLLLSLTGVATALPLLMFAYGARRITLSTIGILQYIAPTMQFILGVTLYDEPFTTTRIIGFSIIWVALAIYSSESIWRSRRAVAAVPISGG